MHTPSTYLLINPQETKTMHPKQQQNGLGLIYGVMIVLTVVILVSYLLG